MTKAEFDKFLAQEKKEVDIIMKEIYEASDRFDQKVKEILQHC